MANDSTIESFAIRFFTKQARDSPEADLVLCSCVAIHINIMTHSFLLLDLLTGRIRLR